MFDGRLVSDSSEVGANASLSTVATDINAFIMGGKAIFMQGNIHVSIVQ